MWGCVDISCVYLAVVWVQAFKWSGEPLAYSCCSSAAMFTVGIAAVAERCVKRARGWVCWENGGLWCDTPSPACSQSAARARVWSFPVALLVRPRVLLLRMPVRCLLFFPSLSLSSSFQQASNDFSCRRACQIVTIRKATDHFSEEKYPRRPFKAQLNER